MKYDSSENYFEFLNLVIKRKENEIYSVTGVRQKKTKKTNRSI